MKPPVCTICKEHFFDGGGIVFFRPDEEDELFNQRFEQEGFVGHPSNAFWFCEKHFAKAKELDYLTKKMALNDLRKYFKS